MKTRRRRAKSGRTHRILATLSATEWRRYVYSGPLSERRLDSSCIARLLQQEHIEMRADPEDTRRSQYRLAGERRP